MKNAPLGTIGEATPAYSRSAIMTAAWARYRQVAAEGGYARFDRRLFGRVLRMAWINARAAAACAAQDARDAEAAKRPAVIRVPSPLEIALDEVKYMPAHMSAARAEAAIRARFTAHA